MLGEMPCRPLPRDKLSSTFLLAPSLALDVGGKPESSSAQRARHNAREVAKRSSHVGRHHGKVFRTCAHFCTVTLSFAPCFCGAQRCACCPHGANVRVGVQNCAQVRNTFPRCLPTWLLRFATSRGRQDVEPAGASRSTLLPAATAHFHRPQPRRNQRATATCRVSPRRRIPTLTARAATHPLTGTHWPSPAQNRKISTFELVSLPSGRLEVAARGADAPSVVWRRRTSHHPTAATIGVTCAELPETRYFAFLRRARSRAALVPRRCAMRRSAAPAPWSVAGVAGRLPCVVCRHWGTLAGVLPRPWSVARPAPSRGCATPVPAFANVVKGQRRPRRMSPAAVCV